MENNNNNLTGPQEPVRFEIEEPPKTPCKHQNICDAGGMITCSDCGEELVTW